MHQILRELRLFRDFNNQELEEIDKICQKITFNKDELIFEAKSPAKNLYIISKGAVELRFEVNYYNASQNITLDRKSRGEAFGWSALTKSNIYTLSARALQNSDLLMINEKDINDLCSKNDHMGYIIMKNISEIIGERFELVQKMLINEIQQNLKEKEL
jgi:signal-transduction protein with cAMP-binding, CBS, and nucleotidyltransferase domain